MKWGDIISSVLLDGKLSYKIVLQNKCFEIPSTTAETIIKIHNYTMHPHDEERSITCKLFDGINLKTNRSIFKRVLGVGIITLIKKNVKKKFKIMKNTYAETNLTEVCGNIQKTSKTYSIIFNLKMNG